MFHSGPGREVCGREEESRRVGSQPRTPGAQGPTRTCPGPGLAQGVHRSCLLRPEQKRVTFLLVLWGESPASSGRRFGSKEEGSIDHVRGRLERGQP